MASPYTQLANYCNLRRAAGPKRQKTAKASNEANPTGDSGSQAKSGGLWLWSSSMRWRGRSCKGTWWFTTPPSLRSYGCDMKWFIWESPGGFLNVPRKTWGPLIVPCPPSPSETTGVAFEQPWLHDNFLFGQEALRPNDRKPKALRPVQQEP